jgi:hypothetical protein
MWHIVVPESSVKQEQPMMQELFLLRQTLEATQS